MGRRRLDSFPFVRRDLSFYAKLNMLGLWCPSRLSFCFCFMIRFSGNQRSKIKQFGQTIGHSKTGWSWHHQEQFICMTTSFSVVCKNITNCELLHKYPVLHYVCCKIMVLLWKITDEILLIPSHVVYEKSCCCCDIIDIVVTRYWSKVRQKLCYCCEELLQIILL